MELRSWTPALMVSFNIMSALHYFESKRRISHIPVRERDILRYFHILYGIPNLHVYVSFTRKLYNTEEPKTAYGFQFIVPIVYLRDSANAYSEVTPLEQSRQLMWFPINVNGIGSLWVNYSIAWALLGR